MGNGQVNQVSLACSSAESPIRASHLILTICTLLTHSNAAAASTLRTEYLYSPSFEHISVKQGLSQSTIHVTLQDSRGFLWFATDLGLNRYDGYRFVSIQRDEEQPTSLQSNLVLAAIIDSNGAIWAGTYRGLNRIDPETLTVEAFAHSAPSEGPTNVVALAAARDGSLWIGGVAGLYHLSPEQVRAKNPRFVSMVDGTKGMEGIFPGGIMSLLEDKRSGVLWIGSRRALYRLDMPVDGKSPVVRPFMPEPIASDVERPDNCRALAEDWAGSLWIGCFNGLFEVDPSRSHMRRYTHDPNDPMSLASNIVMAIHVDRTGQIWVGNDGAGLARMLPRDKNSAPRFLRIRHDPTNDRSLSGDGVQNIFEDSSGVLWVSSYQAGLNKLVLNPLRPDARERPVAYRFRTAAADPQTLSGDTVSAVAEDRFGNLWVGTDGFGLNRVRLPKSTADRLAFERYRASHEAAARTDILKDDVVLALHLDSKKRLWLGTYTHGLVRVDLDSDKAEPRFTYYRSDPADSATIGDDFVRCILDDGTGKLWLCTNGSGLNFFDPDTGTAKRIVLGKNGHPGLWSSNEILAIAMDQYRTLWIAANEGLIRYNPETGEARGYGPSGVGTLSSANILTLRVDRSGGLWVGTSGGGLNWATIPPWNGGDPKFVHFTDKDGLPSKTVKNILEGRNGELWLSTDRWLTRFDLATRRGQAFPYQRDLTDAEYISNSAYQSADGECYIGSNTGLTVFHPRDIQSNPKAPLVAITGFQVLNKHVPLKSRLATGGKYGRNTVLLLRPEDTALAFEFSALHFVAPEMNRYSYMMEGLDSGWIDAGGNHVVSYTTLPPGEYTWRLRAFSCDGVPSAPDYALSVVVLPPWYHSAWFRALLAVLMAVGVYGVIRIRVAVLKARNRQLEEMVLKRTKELDAANRAIEELAMIKGRFRALLKLGEGGMAEVLLAAAMDGSGIRKLVVLKCLRLQLALDAEMCEAFVFEARLMATMNHPNVVKVHDLIDTDESPVIVMEYLEGKTLAQATAESVDPLPLPLRLHVICEVLEGLSYVHALKDQEGVPLELVHRDVSPDNVMVTYDGQVKLLDFGIAKSSAWKRSSRTSTGVLKGKLHYMSPEQLLGSKVDCRTDLFAVGVMLWEALAGRRIWAGMSESAQMKALVNGQLPSLREACPDLPDGICALVRWALEYEAAARIPTAREFKVALLESVQELQLGTGAAELKRFMSTRFASDREEAQKRILRRVEADPNTWSEPPPIAASTGNKFREATVVSR